MSRVAQWLIRGAAWAVGEALDALMVEGQRRGWDQIERR